MSTQGTAPVTPVVEAPETPAVEGAKPDEPLGAPGLAALKSERDARSAAEKRAADAEAQIKAFEDAKKTDAEKQAEALADARSQLVELTLAKTRAEVAATKGVPAELLTGATQEALEASADKLIAFKGTSVPAEKQTYIIPDEGGVPALGKQENIAPGIGTLRAGYAQIANERK